MCCTTSTVLHVKVNVSMHFFSLVGRIVAERFNPQIERI